MLGRTRSVLHGAREELIRRFPNWPPLGRHGIWELPDGRKIFYPGGYGSRGYRLGHRDEQRIRRTLVVAALPLYFVGALLLEHIFRHDDLLAIAGYFAAYFIVNYAVGRFLTRHMDPIAKPLWPLDGIRLAAYSSTRARIVTGTFFVFTVLVALACALWWSGNSKIASVCGLLAAVSFAALPYQLRLKRLQALYQENNVS